MNNTYKIVEGGKIDTSTYPVPTMVDYKVTPYEVLTPFSKNPLGTVNYLLENFLTESDPNDPVNPDNPPIGGDSQASLPKTLSIDIVPEFNDYSYVETQAQLDSVFEFKAIVELILSSCYSYCELIKDDTVLGITLTGDSSGFEIRSKYFNSANKFENYRILLGLVCERFISLKRQYFQWQLKNTPINSIDPSSYNFFIFPSE